MTMWAGVQKVSRPMVSCHEMSHIMPMVMQEAAKASSREGQNAGGLPGVGVTGAMQAIGSVSKFPCITCGFVLERWEYSQFHRVRTVIKCRLKIVGVNPDRGIDPT